VARDHGTGLLFTIDELHYVPESTLEAVVMGLHRANQLRLPITVAGAGLPSLAALTGEAKSYAERMFSFITVGSLRPDLAAEALTLPAADEGVGWDDNALDRVVHLTKGYPYFLQEFGKAAWDAAAGPDRITAEDVDAAVPVAVAGLDDGFFRVRTGRTSSPERLYLRAMAELGPGAVRSGEVASLLRRPVTSLGPTRDQLIKKALCYSPRWGEIDFTVPMFGEFMKRWMPSMKDMKGPRPEEG